jgi:competence protein ComEA
MEDKVNLNTVQSDELTKLPGVGPAMAERIAAARPFEKPEDLLKVSGIGPALLERLSPLVTTEATESQEEEGLIDEDVIYLEAETSPETKASEVPIETLDEAIEDEAIPAWDGSEVDEDSGDEISSDKVEAPEKKEIPKEKAIIPVKKEGTKKKETKKAPEPITWGKALFMAAAFSFVAFILAVLLSIGIIGSMNNGLRFASTEQVQGLSSQIETLYTELGVLSDDLESLRTRVDNLESLSGRVGELELDSEQFSADMALTVETIEGLSTQISEFSESAERFQTFLSGMGELMDTLVEPQPEEVP